MKNRNFLILWVRDALFAASASLTSTSVLSGVLLHIGLTEEKISFYLAAVPLVNLVVSLLFSSVASKTEKIIGTYSFLCLCSGVLTALYVLIFGLIKGLSVLFVFLMILGCLVSGVTAVRNIFDYRLPCEVMDLDSYSSYVAGCGIVGGISGLVAGAVLTVINKKLPLTVSACIAFAVAGICYCAAGLINKYLKPVKAEKTNQREAESRVGLKELFKSREFKLLLIPNFVRGVGMAVVPVVTLIAVNGGAITEADGAQVTVFTYLATLLSCVGYAFLAKKIGVAKLCIIGAVLFCALIPSLVFSKTVFYVCYTVSYTGYYIVNNAVPNLVYKKIDRNLMSIFHTWRLALSTVGTAVATAVIGGLIGIVSPLCIFLIGSVATLFCAVSYAVTFR